MKKIILFGGSFDPVHEGHIEIAKYAHAHIKADKTIFIPARRSPLKPTPPIATNAQRLEMLKLAIEGISGFEVSDVEFSLPEPNYSVNTIAHFKKALPAETQLYWLIGADILSELHKWKKIRELLEMATILAANRGATPLPDLSILKEKIGAENVKKIQAHILDTPQITASSTQIRTQIQNSLLPTGLPNEALKTYIQNQKIYT